MITIKRSKETAASEEAKRMVGSEILDAWSSIKPTANAREVDELGKLIEQTHGVTVHPARIQIYLQKRLSFQPKPRRHMLPQAATELWAEYYETHGGRPDYRNRELVRLLLLPLQGWKRNGREQDDRKCIDSMQSWFRYQKRREKKAANSRATMKQ
jgi:hypothetical protein